MHTRGCLGGLCWKWRLLSNARVLAACGVWRVECGVWKGVQRVPEGEGPAEVDIVIFKGLF